MNGQHFLVTGGSSGIGLAIARALIDEGAHVHLVARGPEALERVQKDLGKRAWVYPCDIVDDAARKAMVDQVAKNCGGQLDGLVVNAAKYGFKPILEVEPAELEAYFRTNTFSTLYLVRETLALLQAGSGKAVLFISSTLSTRPVPGTAAYAASKAAMNSLARSLTLELSGLGIRVNSILPGVVDTPIHEPQTEADPARADKMASLAPIHPIGRVGRPEDVAAGAVYLLSDKASWVTGSEYFLDGGVSLV